METNWYFLAGKMVIIAFWIVVIVFFRPIYRAKNWVTSRCFFFGRKRRRFEFESYLTKLGQFFRRNSLNADGYYRELEKMHETQSGLFTTGVNYNAQKVHLDYDFTKTVVLEFLERRLLELDRENAKQSVGRSEMRDARTGTLNFSLKNWNLKHVFLLVKIKISSKSSNNLLSFDSSSESGYSNPLIYSLLILITHSNPIVLCFEFSKTLKSWKTDREKFHHPFEHWSLLCTEQKQKFEPSTLESL